MVVGRGELSVRDVLRRRASSTAGLINQMQLNWSSGHARQDKGTSPGTACRSSAGVPVNSWVELAHYSQLSSLLWWSKLSPNTSNQLPAGAQSCATPVTFTSATHTNHAWTDHTPSPPSQIDDSAIISPKPLYPSQTVLLQLFPSKNHMIFNSGNRSRVALDHVNMDQDQAGHHHDSTTCACNC